MATSIQTKDTMVIQTYGNRDDIFSLAKRIKIMVPGGSKLNDAEAQALAQVSLVTKCNPFIGEIWYIPGRGPMIGIKGARRHGNEQIEEAGGKDAYWTPDLQVCTPDEAGATGIKDVAFAYRCVITDSVSTLKYQRMFLETVNSLRAAGDPDPVGTSREICGKRPQWIGYGYSTHSEQTKMSKHAAARKRAEADALKQKFDIPFGAEVAAEDTVQETESMEWTDAQFTAGESNIDSDFPPVAQQGSENQVTVEEIPVIEIIEVLGEWAVGEAAKFWNIGREQAAKQIAKKWHGRMDKREFLDLLKNPEPEQPKHSREQNMKELGY